MEKKYSVTEFAELIGTTAKVIYQKIEGCNTLPVNEQLTTVKEQVNGRIKTFIITSDEQITLYKNQIYINGRLRSMEKKFSVADFAELVGTTAKTIYQKIDNYENLPLNEQLTTVKERVKGREITFVVTSDEQIQIYKNLYRKEVVRERDYYENFTNNNGDIPVSNNQNMVIPNNNSTNGNNAFEQLLTLNETYLNRIETVTNELMEYKSKSLLLEDKANREGMYLNNIRELETENNKLKTSNKRLILVLTIIISVLLTVLITLGIVNNIQNKDNNEVTNVSQPVQTETIKKEHAKK